MWYESVIPEEDFQKLDFAQRDAALLQGTTISNENQGDFPKTVLEETTSIESLSVNDFSLENCYIDDSGNLIAEEGAQLALPLLNKGSDEGEYLFSLTIASKDDSQYYLTVNGKEQLVMPSTYAWRYPLNDYSFKIPTEDEQILCEITPGTYEISNVRLAWSSYSEARRWISERNKVNLEDLKVSPDHISGKIQSQSAGILVLSMPYSDGWSCLVDGKEHPTILANHAFLGIELEPGQHEIELTFFPKMLRIGLAVTG